jgi:rhamnose transport system ATP-binding protein
MIRFIAISPNSARQHVSTTARQHSSSIAARSASRIVYDRTRMTTGGLEFRGVAKAFGAVHALRGVSFGVAPGEAHACVGENGAGKSTLLKILAGIIRPDRGELWWAGEQLHFASPREALERGIGMVYQEMLAFRNLSVSANIFAGREITSSWGRLDEKAMRVRTQELLTQLHVPVTPDTSMEHVSTATAQLVQVARALAFDCRVLVLDEPTTSLTDAEVDHLFSVVARLRATGVTVLFVSHRLPEVYRLCDRITVLRDGQFAGTFDRATTPADDIVRAMVGREPPARVERKTERSSKAVAPALAVRGLTRRPAFENVSFAVAPGEIVGVFGLVGSGRTEILETLFGLAKPDSGEVAIDGRSVYVKSACDAAKAGFALVPEDRQRQGLFFNLSLRHNLVLPLAAKQDVRVMDDRAEERTAGAQVSALSIKTPHLGVTPDALSGGNQQKVVAGKWLATAPRVLLLDEPTKGVDVGAKFEIHNLIRREADAGMACLMVSSDLPEVLALADRILVMREGHLRGELSGAGATDEAVMRLATHDVDADAAAGGPA